MTHHNQQWLAELSQTETAGAQGYAKAEVTGGGLPLEQVNCATLESLLRPGLFVCGELLDVFGRIGGFNFYLARYSCMRHHVCVLCCCLGSPCTWRAPLLLAVCHLQHVFYLCLTGGLHTINAWGACNTSLQLPCCGSAPMATRMGVRAGVADWAPGRPLSWRTARMPTREADALCSYRADALERSSIRRLVTLAYGPASTLSSNTQPLLDMH